MILEFTTKSQKAECTLYLSYGYNHRKGKIFLQLEWKGLGPK
jgi:hypothetical protein